MHGSQPIAGNGFNFRRSSSNPPPSERGANARDSSERPFQSVGRIFGTTEMDSVGGSGEALAMLRSIATVHRRSRSQKVSESKWGSCRTDRNNAWSAPPASDAGAGGGSQEKIPDSAALPVAARSTAATLATAPPRNNFLREVNGISMIGMARSNADFVPKSLKLPPFGTVLREKTVRTEG